MLLTRNLFIAVLLGIMIAVVVSFLPMTDIGHEKQLAPVFQPFKPLVLKRDNIVDVLTLFETRLPLVHVQWQNDNLFVDYKVDKNKPIYVEDIYTDLYITLKSVYTLTSNVQGLYVRILYSEKGQNEVLIALSAERSGKLIDSLDSIKNKREFLQEHTTLSYGVLWQENFLK